MISREYQKGSSLELIPAPPITIDSLFGGGLPKQEGIQDFVSLDGKKRLSGTEVYQMIGKKCIHSFQVKDFQTRTTHHIAHGPILSGIELNALLHIASPEKLTGFDPNDIFQDWYALYQDVRHTQRLDRHKSIPGWKEFEPFRNILMQTIARDYYQCMGMPGIPSHNEHLLRACNMSSEQELKQSYRTHPEKKIFPVIWVSEHPDGEISWNFDLDSHILQKTIWQVHRGPPTETYSIIPSVGPTIIAAFSPEMVQSWPKQHGYTIGETNRRDMNSITATQSLVFSLWYQKDLLRSDLIQRLVHYNTHQKI